MIEIKDKALENLAMIARGIEEDRTSEKVKQKQRWVEYVPQTMLTQLWSQSHENFQLTKEPKISLNLILD